MSTKINTFASVITQPQNTHNFRIMWPEMDPNVNLIVESSKFPEQKHQMYKLNFQGFEINYPALPKTGAAWQIAIPENDDGRVRHALENRRLTKVYNQKTGHMLPHDTDHWSTIAVKMMDLEDRETFSVLLHGCWIIGRNDVTIDAKNSTTNWKWDYSLQFQWIEDLMKVSAGAWPTELQPITPRPANW